MLLKRDILLPLSLTGLNKGRGKPLYDLVVLNKIRNLNIITLLGFLPPSDTDTGLS